jgi:hypothetical protein
MKYRKLIDPRRRGNAEALGLEEEEDKAGGLDDHQQPARAVLTM